LTTIQPFDTCVLSHPFRVPLTLPPITSCFLSTPLVVKVNDLVGKLMEVQTGLAGLGGKMATMGMGAEAKAKIEVSTSKQTIEHCAA